VRSTAALIALCLRRRRFAVAEADQKRDPGLETAGIWRMSVKNPMHTPSHARV
jgi:hypothetical protein